MRMAELSHTSGCTVATIKYYLRQGLLMPGQGTAVTQATYERRHLDRLRLIRVLREVGDIPVARVGEVLAAIDDTQRPLVDVLRAAHHALGPAPVDEGPGHAEARREVVGYVVSRGWDVDPRAPSFDVLAGALTALRRLGYPCSPEVFSDYADAAFALAGAELDGGFIDPSGGPAATVAQVVVGTVVYEQALSALRRLAEEHHSNRRFGVPVAKKTGRRRR
jgi:DNA-binding transcriptional MerR regulator